MRARSSPPHCGGRRPHLNSKILTFMIFAQYHPGRRMNGEDGTWGMQKVRLRDLHRAELENPWENTWAGIKHTPRDMFLTLTFQFVLFFFSLLLVARTGTCLLEGFFGAVFKRQRYFSFFFFQRELLFCSEDPPSAPFSSLYFPSWTPVKLPCMIYSQRPLF